MATEAELRALAGRTEAEWENVAIRELARDTLGYMAEHTRSGRTAAGRWETPHTVPGFPDWALYRGPPLRHVLVEMKAKNGWVEPEQLACIIELRRRGAEVYLWRDGRITLQEIAEILTRPFTGHPAGNTDLRWEIDRINRREAGRQRRAKARTR